MPIYDYYRPNIKTGDLLVWKTTNWNSAIDWMLQIVRLVRRTEITHVGVAFVVGGRVLVVEAVYPNVRIYPLSKLLPFYHVGLGMPWEDSKDDILLEHIGEKYSIPQAIMSAFREPKDDNMWQCAELAKKIYTELGYSLDGIVTPDHLVDEMLNNSQTGLVKVASMD